ncbi:MAG TPA: hypothetical protein VJ550_06295 [Geomonas sp.]|nr:hypothetical protein [Geomonas sp.]
MKGIAALTGKMDRRERILLAVSGLLVLVACLIPIWQINLLSPQYPEGLHLVIRAQHITGNVQSVNILNHYIGMKPISDAAFPEFGWMRPALLTVGGLLLLIPLLGRRELANLGRLLLFSFDGYMMWDLYRWLYDWGHNLDRRAPITVPPFTPPLLGVRQIANFHVLSIPSWGGSSVMLATLLGGYSLWHAMRHSS